MESKFCEICQDYTPHSFLGKVFYHHGEQEFIMRRLQCVFCGKMFDTMTFSFGKNYKKQENQKEV